MINKIFFKMINIIIQFLDFLLQDEINKFLLFLIYIYIYRFSLNIL